jgi:hypothetical protein
MDWLKVLSVVLRIPLWLLILASFVGAIYAAANKIQNITYVTPLIMGTLIVLYLVGIFLGRKNEQRY